VKGTVLANRGALMRGGAADAAAPQVITRSATATAAQLAVVDDDAVLGRMIGLARVRLGKYTLSYIGRSRHPALDAACRCVQRGIRAAHRERATPVDH
jgi:hypothetical protein